MSIDCCLGDDDTIFGGDGEVDYLVGGALNDAIKGEDGPDLVFGDHAFITFDKNESHKLRYARTTNHSCSGGNDIMDLGVGDVSHKKRYAQCTICESGYEDLTIDFRCLSVRKGYCFWRCIL